MARVVVHTMRDPDPYQALVKELGAGAFVSKHAPPEELMRAVRAVASDEANRAGSR